MKKGLERGRRNGKGRRDGEEGAYAGDDLVVVCEVGFAVFAAVDFFGVEVDVVGEAHLVQVVGWEVVVMGLSRGG